MPASAQLPLEPRGCGGKEATITGSSLGDVLRGTEKRDVIAAGAGDDIVLGLAARDVLCGEDGNDTISGGRGNERAFGGAGDDRIVGGIGNDRLRGETGDDTLEGGRSNDYVNGGDDRDFVDGNLGDDRVFGGPGVADHVAGGLGIDRVNGGPGDYDLVHGDYGWDRMIGGPGQGDIGSFFSATSGQQGPGQEIRPPGIRASLRRGLAIGDGKDILRSLESLEGSAFDDVLIGRGRPASSADGGLGSDRCRGFDSRSSCGSARRHGAMALIDSSPSRSGTLTLLGGPRRDVLRLISDPATGVHRIRSRRPLALGPGCSHPAGKPRIAVCQTDPSARHRTIDLGDGNDRLVIVDAEGREGTRVGAGAGDDEVHGGPGGELIEAGEGADRLLGGAGSDGLVGGFPGPDLISGQSAGDLLAAAGACVGGVLRGGPGRDNASFAEAPGHPGVMIASLTTGRAYITKLPRCKPVRIHGSAEDLEGTFDWDILIGDERGNSLLGQPGKDRFYGLGGLDQINAYDRQRDFFIDCGRGGGIVLGDRRDPHARRCEEGEITGPAAELPRLLPGR